MVTIIVKRSILIGCFVTVKYHIEIADDLNHVLGLIYPVIDRVRTVIVFDLFLCLTYFFKKKVIGNKNGEIASLIYFGVLFVAKYNLYS